MLCSFPIHSEGYNAGAYDPRYRGYYDQSYWYNYDEAYRGRDPYYNQHNQTYPAAAAATTTRYKPIELINL